MSQIRNLAKQLKLGKLKYNLYHLPIKLAQKWSRLDSYIDLQAMLEMENATYKLRSLHTDHLPKLDIYFLTGKKYWYQTCFCAYSMARFSPDHQICPIIYDDGSLAKPYQDEILRIFPNAKIFLKTEVEATIENYLPIAKFPYLRERRLNYPNMRKVTDIHTGSQGWKLVLDSDMLFFQTPKILLDWLQNPQNPCHMIDVETSYGYSPALMSSLANAEIADRLNVGICGLNSTDLDWEKIEYWCKTMIEAEGTHYYQEQALVAMLMAGQSCTVAPASEYIVMPTQSEAMQPQAILHHYVADSKPWYFRYAWKHIHTL